MIYQSPDGHREQTAKDMRNCRDAISLRREELTAMWNSEEGVSFRLSLGWSIALLLITESTLALFNRLT
jgi:hypothetical protein